MRRWWIVAAGVTCGMTACGGDEQGSEVDARETSETGEVGPETAEVETVDSADGDTVGPGETDDTEDIDDTADTTTPDGRAAWTQSVAGWGTLETVAGKGAQRDEGNEWLASYEGGPATACELSRPHMAMADAANRIFIADKEAHAVRRVDPDGTIHTVAGTGVAGDDGDAPRPGATSRLNDPNGLYIIASGAVHILDLGNGKIRRLAPDGTLTTFIAVPGGIRQGRGLWVADDEAAAFIADGDRVLHWDAGGVTIYADGFGELGNLVVAPDGALVVTDRGTHRVYRIAADGEKTVIAGNGQITGGGDGALATESGLEEPRAVWFMPPPIGGFFVGTHEGNQVWYVDPAGVLHLFLDGGDGHAHSGDGQYFRTPGQKVSEVRAVTVAPNGDILITENDYGFIRRVLKR